MPQYLEKLLPADPLFWYGMNDRLAGGQMATFVADYSANGLVLQATAPAASWENTPLFPHNNLNFDAIGNVPRRDFGGTRQLRHLFTLANHTGANFGANFRGLVTGIGAANFGVLVGNANLTTFFSSNFSSVGTFIYKKSQVTYPETNQLAPFGKFELLDVSLSTGWNLDGLQIGKDRADDTRKWLGRVGETIGYERVLTATESAQVNMYFDLKYGLWRTNGTTLTFPNPTITGILYNRFYADVPDYQKVTVSHEYDDGGKSFSTTSDRAPRTWEVEFNCVRASHAESKSITDIFDAFYNQARLHRTFNFTDKYGETHTGVRVADYNRTHQDHKSWSQNASFKLVKLP